MALSGKKLRFAQEYAVDHNATQAAIRAGYSARTAYSAGSRLLKDVEVRQHLNLAELTAAERANVSTVRVLEELRRIALCDIGQAFDKEGKLLPIHKIPADVRRAISGIEVEELGQHVDRQLDDGAVLTGATSRTVKLKFWDKNKAAELIARHLGMLVDKVQHSGTVSFEQLVAEASKPASAIAPPLAEPERDE